MKKAQENKTNVKGTFYSMSITEQTQENQRDRTPESIESRVFIGVSVFLFKEGVQRADRGTSVVFRQGEAGKQVQRGQNSIFPVIRNIEERRVWLGSRLGGVKLSFHLNKFAQDEKLCSLIIDIVDFSYSLFQV